MIRRRRAQAAVLATAVAALTSFAGAAPAQATAYRYWSYWKWSGSTWVYQNVGPSGNVSPGEVIGWRFAVQPDSVHAHTPRASGDFATLCPGHPDGRGVVIDYGVSSDAPSGEQPPRATPRGFCATDSSDRNGYQVTAEHAALRVNNDGLVCGIDGYPKTECAAAVQAVPTPKPTPKPTSAATTPSHAQRHHGGAARKNGQLPATSSPHPSEPAAGASSKSPRPIASTPTASTTQPTTAAEAPTPTPTLLLDETAPGTSNTKGVPVGLIVGVVLAVALGAGAVWQYRVRS